MDAEREYRPHMTPVAAALRAGPLARCPGCGTPLDGGPVLYHCEICHHAVSAADVDTDHHAPRTAAA